MTGEYQKDSTSSRRSGGSVLAAGHAHGNGSLSFTRTTGKSMESSLVSCLTLSAGIMHGVPIALSLLLNHEKHE